MASATSFVVTARAAEGMPLAGDDFAKSSKSGFHRVAVEPAPLQSTALGQQAASSAESRVAEKWVEMEMAQVQLNEAEAAMRMRNAVIDIVCLCRSGSRALHHQRSINCASPCVVCFLVVQ